MRQTPYENKKKKLSVWFCWPFNKNRSIIILAYIAPNTYLSEVSKRSTIMQHNYPGFRSAAVTSAAFLGINSYQVPIYFTWVECGICRSMSCQRTLVRRRDSNRGPCDRQTCNVSTRPQHLVTVHEVYEVFLRQNILFIDRGLAVQVVNPRLEYIPQTGKLHRNTQYAFRV